jgi:S1-C subfamily serine protease
MAEVVNYIIRMSNALETGEKLAFVKTSDADSRSAPRFKVTLGIMPDYFYEGRGIKVDGVTAGRPADKAGVLKGDLLLELGDYELADMQAYMQALAAFNKGNSTKIKLIRGTETLELNLTF